MQDRVDTIREMVSLGCDQIRAMAFVPQAGTPMQDVPVANSIDELRCIAVMRLLQHDAFIPATLDVEGIAGMRTRLDAGASTVTSIIPAASHLAGVAQSEMDIEDGHRCADYVIARLREMGREPATASDLKREFDRRKRRLADRLDLRSPRDDDRQHDEVLVAGVDYLMPRSLGADVHHAGRQGLLDAVAQRHPFA